MAAILIRREKGLALMGSLLLVSMLAVMSTAFLLIMAADVRIAQSHFRSIQAYYLAVTAAEIAALEISSDPSALLAATETDTLIKRITDVGEFYVFSYPMNPPVANKCELRIRAISGRAWFDLYVEILIPSQDPRTYFPIVAGNELKLDANCQVIGGEGVWSMGDDPVIDEYFLFNSPSLGNGMLYTSGSVRWGDNDVAPELTDVLSLYTNYPAVDDIFPQLLDDESGEYPYYITGDPQKYNAIKLSGPNVSGSLPTPGAGNPMAIYVWDYDVNGTFSGDFNIDGTIVCPGTGRLKFENGDVTISPKFTGTTPNEFYPAIISRGDIHVRGSGTRTFFGLVYTAKKFDSGPTGGTLHILGALIARDVDLKNNSVISYSDSLKTIPAAAFSSNSSHIYPTISLHRKRFIDTPPLPP